MGNTVHQMCAGRCLGGEGRFLVVSKQDFFWSGAF